MKRRESVGGNKRRKKETKEEWKDGLMEGPNKEGRKEEVRNDGMHKGRKGRSKRGRKECRGKEGRKNKQAEKGIPGTFSEVQRCFKAKRLTYTELWRERPEERGSEG